MRGGSGLKVALKAVYREHRVARAAPRARHPCRRAVPASLCLYDRSAVRRSAPEKDTWRNRRRGFLAEICAAVTVVEAVGAGYALRGERACERAMQEGEMEAAGGRLGVHVRCASRRFVNSLRSFVSLVRTESAVAVIQGIF